MASLSSPFINVGVNMVLYDQFTQNSGRVTSAFQTMMGNLKSSARAVQDTYGTVFDASVRGARSVYNAYKAYASVDKDIFLTGKMAGATAQQMKELRDLAEETNLVTPLTTGDIASAERFLAMAGNSVEKIHAMIPTIAQLSSVFGMEAGGKGGVADLVTNIMSMYQLSADQVKSVGNDLYVATTSANMDLRDLANSIKYAGAEMATMGYDVRETAAAIGLMGDMGIQGSMAGTALANTMRYLRQSLAGTKESGAKALERLGLSKEDFLDANGELRDLYKVYSTIAKAASRAGISGFETSNLITDITGVRGSRNMLAVVRQLQTGTDTFSKMMNAFALREGELERTAQEYMDTPQGRLDKLVSTLDAIQQKMGGFASKFIGPLLDMVNGILGAFYKLTDIPVVGQLMSGVLVAAFVSPLIIGVKMMRQLVITLKASVNMANASLNRMQQLTAKQMALNATYASHLVTRANNIPLGGRMDLGAGNYITNKSGKPTLHYRDPDTGKMRRTTDPSKMSYFFANNRMPGKGGTPSGGPGNTFGKWFPGLSKGFLGKGLGMVGKGLGAVAGIFGGPVGIAIFAGVSLLPSLIDAIKGNTQSQKDALEAKREEIRNMSTQDYWAYREKKLAAAFEGLQGKAVGKVNILINGKPYEAEAGDTVSIDDLYGVVDTLTSD